MNLIAALVTIVCALSLLGAAGYLFATAYTQHSSRTKLNGANEAQVVDERSSRGLPDH
jgi:hypothetical protein